MSEFGKSQDDRPACWQGKEQLARQFMNMVSCQMYLRTIGQDRSSSVNRAIAEALGYALEAGPPAGVDFFQRTMHREDYARLQEHDKQLAALGRDETVEFEYRIRHRNGSWRWYLNRDTIFQRTENGGAVQIIGTATDITERRAAENQKTAFTRIVLHDLRSPLTGLMAFLSLSRRKITEPETDTFLEKAYNCALKMKMLIQDFQDIHYLQLGQLFFELSEFDFDTLVKNAIDEIAAIHENFTIQRYGQTGLRFTGDPIRLRQAVVNLLNIAAKYGTAEDRVDITLLHRDANVQITIRNYGIGLESEEIQAILNYTGREEINHRIRTMVMSLYLVRQIVSFHGGQVSIQSQLKEGITFVVDLPLKS